MHTLFQITMIFTIKNKNIIKKKKSTFGYLHTRIVKDVAIE